MLYLSRGTGRLGGYILLICEKVANRRDLALIHPFSGRLFVEFLKLEDFLECR